MLFFPRVEIAPANECSRMSFQWSCKDEKRWQRSFLIKRRYYFQNDLVRRPEILDTYFHFAQSTLLCAIVKNKKKSVRQNFIKR